MASPESPTTMSIVVSPPGTPSRDGSASPVLTPKSKVEAMLAEMEPTDEESGGSDGAADEDSEIELDYKPKGKLASRMMPRASDIKATKSTKIPPTIKNNTTGNGDAYERVKQSLLAGKEMTSKILISDEESGNEEDKSASSSKALVQTDDDDDDLPVPTPRRKRTRKALPNASPKANSTRSTESPKQKGPSQSKSTTPVSASESEGGDEGGAHNLLATDPKKNARFLELVEKKRKERQAAEAEKQRLEEKRKQLDAQLGCGSETDDGEDDDDLGVLSQKPPRRKSGKKALEEMHRESQRMARNMHLEYQARTKKTITKQSLFEKFGFRAPAEKQDESKKDRVPVDSRYGSPYLFISNIVISSFSSIITGSETEPADQSSPNSSPLPEADEKSAKIATDAMDIDNQSPSTSEGPMQGESNRMGIDSTSAPKLDKGKGKARATSEGFDEEETAHPAHPLDKGKGKAIEVRSSALDKGKGKASIVSSKKAKLVLPPVRVILPNKLTENASDSDSELEIVKPGDEERIANSERKKMVDQLRRVRRVKPPVEAHGKPKLSVRELEAELRKKSRQQAIQEREERIEELKAKGVIILTAEEKAKTEQQAVDYMEKARKEALAVKRREKKDGIKKEGATIDDMDPNEDDEADGDWLEEEDIVEILSGSEEEEEEEEEGEEEAVEPSDLIDEDENELMGGLGSPAFSSLYPQDNDLLSPTPRLSEMPAAYIDEEADEDSDESNGDFAPFKTLKRKAIRKKKLRVVEEDEDGENDDAIESEEQKIAESRIPSIFRNKIAGPPPVGMTQLFNGLSGLPPSAEVSASPEKVKERIEALRQDLGEGIPNSQVPLDFGDDRLDLGFVKKKDGEDSEPIDEPSFPVLDLYYEPSTQMSSFPDPTQDDDFVKSSSPAPPRFDEDEPSTIEVPDSQPPKRKRGRLVKKGADLTAVMEEDENEKESDGERKSEEVEEKEETAFDVMRKAAKKEKAAENFDKTKSGAREMVHEQAEESEDEYAGIGGASDDEAGGGHDSDVEEMIDDEGKEVVDEDEIAAFWAEQDKAQDEKDVSKLFRDLQTGLFRKKRGADFDLDDSDDDDGEARRRAKRRQMAKIRKALMTDGNIEKLATNPKKLAFLSAIEDRDRDDEMDFLDKGEEDLFIDLGLLEDSQSRNPSQSHDSREASTVAGAGASRGGTPGSQHSAGESNETPIITNTRRTTRPKKPSLADVREVG